MNMGIKKGAIYCGIFAPILFVTIFTLEGFLREDYSPMRNFISELSIGNRGWIQITNFVLFGSFMWIFALGLFREFRRRKLPAAGPVLLLILAPCYLLSGPFVTDPGTIFTEQKSIHGFIHGILGGIVFTLMPVTVWTFLKPFRMESNFKQLRWVSLFFAVILTITLIIFTYVTKMPDSPTSLSGMNGFFQRLALIPFMIWLCYLAVVLRKTVT